MALFFLLFESFKECNLTILVTLQREFYMIIRTCIAFIVPCLFQNSSNDNLKMSIINLQSVFGTQTAGSDFLAIN